MGVRGLYSFIEEYSRDSLQPRKLHHCTVVIDGLNLAHHLQAHCKGMNAAFNGDYDKFAKTVEDFFSSLAECGIRPVVLLDGSFTMQKIGTIMTRTKERIRQCLHCTPINQNRKRIFPLFSTEVFISVMREKGVHFQQCEQEADSVMVQLSNALKAPIISNDTDFYVYDVQYIPLHSLVVEPVKNEDIKYLDCQEFVCQNFLKNHGVDRAMLPLFAALVGNDYVSASQFEAVYSAIKQHPKKKRMSHQHQKIWRVLGWLRHQEDLEAATEKVLQFIKEDDRARVRRAIHLGMDDYVTCCTEQNQDPQNEVDVIDRLLNRSWTVKHCDGREIPESFMTAFKNSSLARYCLDMIIQRFAILKSQVECYRDATSFESALHLLLAMGWILVGDSSDDSKLTLYMRRLDRLDKKVYSLKQSFQMWADVPGMSDIQGLPLKSRKSLFLRIMLMEDEEDSVERFPDDLRLFLLSTIYWIRFSKSPVMLVHSLSIALCLLFINVIEHRKRLPERNIKELAAMGEELKAADISQGLKSEGNQPHELQSTEKPALELKYEDNLSRSQKMKEKESHEVKDGQDLLQELKTDKHLSRTFQQQDRLVQSLELDNNLLSKLNTQKDRQERLKAKENELQELNFEEKHSEGLTRDQNLLDELSTLTFEDFISRVSNKECIVAKCILIKYLPINSKVFANSDKYFEKNYVQVFSNLQAILHVTRSLNAIFGDVYSNPTIQHLLSGSLFYNICSDLVCRKEPEKYIVDMLEGTPYLCALFNLMFGCIDKCDQSATPSSEETSKKKACKFKRAARSVKPEGETIADVVAVEECSQHAYAVSLENKFQGILDQDK